MLPVEKQRRRHGRNIFTFRSWPAARHPRVQQPKSFASRVRKRTAALLALLLPLCARAAPFLPPRAVPLGAPEKFQYVLFDPGRNRVFVAHGNEVTVVDAAALAVIGHITGLAGAHGVALVPGGEGYADSGRAATVSIFDPASFHVLATLKADTDAYAVVYDPASRHVFVMNDDAGTITVIDPARRAVIATIALTPGFESAEADGQGHLFIAHSEAHQLLRIDTRRNLADAAWTIPACGEPHGLAADSAGHRIFVSCPTGTLVALDSGTGRELARLPIGRGGDTLLFDSLRHRLYSPNPGGTLSVIDTAARHGLAAEPDMPIPPGARTGAIDPATGRIFLVTATVAGTEPAKKPGAPAKLMFVPGSTRLLVFDPAQAAPSVTVSR
jgi:YVTN family beta-propeller protein